jgi:hypothetical protein
MMKTHNVFVLCFNFVFVTILCAEDFPQSSSMADFEKSFSETSSLTQSEKDSVTEDRFHIGGKLAIDFFDTGIGTQDQFQNVNQFWLYGDAKLRNDIRAYIKALSTFVTPETSNTQSFSQATEGVSLEELKLFFNANNWVFFTVGQQKIKWGSSKFWNPTDIINSSKRNLLYSDDRRAGVNLLKTHLPVGAANFYYVTALDDANRVAELGHYGRLEWPIGSSEISFTVGKKYDDHAVYGADVSVGVWDIDFYSELAFSRGSNSIFYNETGAYTQDSKNTTNWTLGLSYEMKYSDLESLSLGFEYFHNGDGYKNTNNYAYVLAAEAYVPFYLSQQYFLMSIYIPEPGSWNDTAITLSTIANITDKTYLSKLNFGVTLAQDLSLDLGLSFRLGSTSGELRYGDQRYQLESRLAVQF